ncbi:MAG: hypothetical protein ACKOXO_10405 [Cyanobium sp.]
MNTSRLDGSSPLPDLAALEAEARRRGLLLRLQVRRPLGVLWSLRVGVARPRPAMPGPAPGPGGEGLELLGDLKGYALPLPDGLRLDTLRVAGRLQRVPDLGVAPLITAATYAWALECTPCRLSRILAIRDEERQHRRLVRYFQRLGFTPVRELGAAVGDLPARMIWGGSGLLMQGECRTVLRRSASQLGLL